MINYRPICIAEQLVCDGFVDCVGGEDEADSFCRNYSCKPGQFYCSGTHKCLSPQRVCDGVYDCAAGDDETEDACSSVQRMTEDDLQKHYDLFTGLNETHIPEDSRMAVFYGKSLVQCARECDRSENFVCVGFVHYAVSQYYGSKCFLMSKRIVDPTARRLDRLQAQVYYEVPTGCNRKGDFQCQNGRCALKSETCNGFDDCGDFSDEINEECGRDWRQNYELSLTGGSDNHEGRVEVRLFSEWGLVCDRGLDAAVADTVCRQLGYAMGHERFLLNAWHQFGKGNGNFILSGLKCPPAATAIDQCERNQWGNGTGCGNKNVAGVVCAVDRACTRWELRCDQRCLSLSRVCDGTADCSDGWDETGCGDLSVRLGSDGNSSSGVVEVERAGISGVVCDDEFGVAEAAVVCRQLGIAGRASIAARGQFRPASGLVMWLQAARCSGSESSIFDCSLAAWGESSCTVDEAAAVVCGLPEMPPATAAPTTVPDFSSVCGTRRLLPSLMRIGGGRGARRREVPWQVGIRKKLRRRAGLRRNIKKAPSSAAWCGGTIIGDRWILTAAHCFPFSNMPKSAFAVIAGDHNNSGSDPQQRQFDVDLMLKHPRYTGPPAYDYDICLLRLKPDTAGFLEFNDEIRPACLPQKDGKLSYSPEDKCIISGWGSMGGFKYPQILQTAEVPLIPRETCDRMYEFENITARMLCAGYKEGGVDSCQGDSGGPLACRQVDDSGTERFTVTGVTSFGNGCAEPNSPGVYTNVPFFRDWIDATIAENWR